MNFTELSEKLGLEEDEYLELIGLFIDTGARYCWGCDRELGRLPGGSNHLGGSVSKKNGHCTKADMDHKLA